MQKSLFAIPLACAVAMPVTASAATMNFKATLQELNNSGVSGVIKFVVDTAAQQLRVSAKVMGLAPDQPHVNHIHGRFDSDGNPRNSEVPTDALDADGDGFLEVLEAAPAYGDVLLSLEDPTDLANGVFHQGPVADTNGMVAYDFTYDLTNDDLFFSTVFGTDYDSDDLMPLDLREYVIHGAFVPAGVNDNLPNGGYLATLPVAAAEISAVPVPAGAVLLLTGLMGFGAIRRRR